MERETCTKCGNPLITVIPGKLLRCSVCGLYRRIRLNQTSPSSPKNLKTETPESPFLAPPAVTGELKIFAERVIYTLCPAEKGYAPVIVKQVRAIYDVLEGRKDFAEWFTKTRQMLSIKNYELAKTLYDCLEGLKGQEARELREQWHDYIASEVKGYGLA
jgi:uncharacterized Zn finger protein (UPF0148 family)